MKTFYVYILASKKNGVLYTGVTNDLTRRIFEHKQKLIDGFTAKYNIHILVHYEQTNDVNAAIKMKKQIKSWLRIKKIQLIEENNPTWKDLSDDWY